MEKAGGNRFSDIRTDDKDPVNPEKTDSEDIRSEAKRARNVKERTRAEIPPRSAEKTAIDRIRENDPSVRRQLATKAAPNNRDERINCELRINDGRVQH